MLLHAGTRNPGARRFGWRTAIGAGLFGIGAWSAPAQTQSAATSYYWSPYPSGAYSYMQGVALDADGNVYATSSGAQNLVKVSAAGAVTSLAGSGLGVNGFSDGTGTAARFDYPQGLTVDFNHTIYVAEYGNSVIRRVSESGVVTTWAGVPVSPGYNDGVGSAARFSYPRGVAVDGIGNVYVADNGNGRIRKISVGNVVTTVAGGGSNAYDGFGTIASFRDPWGIALDRAGNLFVTDAVAQTVRKITPDGWVSTIAGALGVAGATDGVGSAARFNQPTGVAVDSAGNVFVAESLNHTIRRIAPDGQVTTIGGNADGVSRSFTGVGSAAGFFYPYGVAVSSTGTLYVAHGIGLSRGEPTRAPVISAQPQGVTVLEARAASLAVTAIGVPPPTYQWRLNGAAVPGATLATLNIAAARAPNGGDYTVTVTNALGSVTSAVATLAINYPPMVAVQPQATVFGRDGLAQLSVSASGTGNLTYQWFRDGSAIAGATNAGLQTNLYGDYRVVIGNSFGSVDSSTVRVDYPNRVVNLSARGAVASGTSALVAGLTVTAPPGKTKLLLIRGIGPALTQFGVPGAVARTLITLKDGRGTVILSNQGWSTSPSASSLPSVASGLGAFGLPPGSGDSALFIGLAQGTYTVAVEPPAGTAPGAGMVELYEYLADGGRLTNLSTRGQVGDAGGMTVGFVAQGAVSPNLLVRAIGPGLTQFGVAGALARPVLVVFDGTIPIAINTGWTSAANATQIEDVAQAVGAFALARDSGDCAALLTLTPGRNYTVQVNGMDGTTGVALIEIYQVP